MMEEMKDSAEVVEESIEVTKNMITDSFVQTMRSSLPPSFANETPLDLLHENLNVNGSGAGTHLTDTLSQGAIEKALYFGDSNLKSNADGKDEEKQML